MRPLVLVLTASLDGFIADPEGGVGWLGDMPSSPPEDYFQLMASIDTLVMGRGTYEVSLALKGGLDVFAGKSVYVFTSSEAVPRAGVTFVSGNAVEFTESLKHTEGGAIWLFGGGKLATALSDADLVDDYLIVVQPILLGEGIPLWVSPHARTQLELVTARPWPGGAAELRYRRAERDA